MMALVAIVTYFDVGTFYRNDHKFIILFRIKGRRQHVSFSKNNVHH